MKYTIPKFLLIVLFPSIAFGQFGDPVRISMPMAQGVNAIRQADLDGDGDKDILSGSGYNGQIAWYNNDGTGHFSAEKDIASNPGVNHISDVMAVDMDGDGDLDIVSAARVSNEIALYPNLGDGEFGGKQLLSNQATDAIALAVFDADNDGDPDIVCALASSTNLVVYIQNNGNMSFGAQTTISTALYDATCIEAADIDEDGDKDLLVLAAGGIYGLINTNGAFASPVQMAYDSYGFTSLRYGDINGDGHQDIVTCGYNSSSIKWFANNGSGQFGSAQIILSGIEVRDIFPADMDNDGDLDMTAAVLDEELRWYEHMANGTFTEHLIEAVRGTRLLVTDADEDGDPDVFSASHEDDVIRCHLQVSDTFPPSVRLAGGTYIPSSLAHADIDGDGDVDLISGSVDFVNWFPNNGDGTFGDMRVIVSNYYSGFFRVAAEDIDNDGDVDVITYTESGDMMIKAVNDGTGNFVYSILPGNAYSILKEIFFLDYDNDGDKDIFSAGSDHIKLTKNDGTGNFTSININNSVVNNALALTMWDMNGDGRLDPLYAYQHHVGYHITNVNGTFNSNEHVTLSNQDLSAAEFLDLDEDGFVDILCGNDSGTIGWLKATSNGYWEPFAPLGNQLENIRDIVLADPDNDGDLDFFCIYGPIGSYQVNYYERTGSMQFVAHTISNLGQVETLDFYDYDNDGDLDLFAGAQDQVIMADNQLHAPYQAKGVLFIDHNQNGVKDAGDNGVELVKVLSNPQAYYAFSGQDGTYYLNFDGTPGTYSLLPQISSNWTITTGQPSYTATVSGPALQLDTLDFGLYPSTPLDSVVSTLTGGFPRCNTVINYYLNTGNRGSSVVSGILDLELDPEIDFISAAISPDSTNGQHVYWHFDNLSYFSDELLAIQVQMPDFNSMGNVLKSVLTATVQDVSGNAAYVSTDTLSQVLVCAYDPNDKAVMPAGAGPDGIIPVETPYLDYFVRFQNTGNDTAVTVIVRDIIDENLNYLQLVPLASSHQMEVSVEPDGKIAFVFENIMLPDSTTNETASHGFVRFRVPVAANQPSGTVITNKVRIYFDANPAVETNTTVNTLIAPTTYSAINVEECAAYTSPSGQYTWTASGIYTDTLSNMYDTDSVVTVTLTILQTYGSISVNACNAYVSPSGNETWLASGTYLDTIPNAAGCDSIITVNLVIGVEATMLEDGTLQAEGNPAAAYQWVDCGNGYAVIPGADEQLFMPAENGSYAVIRTENNCSDTSACVIVSELLVQLKGDAGTMTIAPNPTEGKLTVTQKQGAGITGWELMTISGQRVSSSDFAAVSSVDLYMSGEPGMYLLVVFCNDGTSCCLPVVKY